MTCFVGGASRLVRESTIEFIRGRSTEVVNSDRLAAMKSYKPWPPEQAYLLPLSSREWLPKERLAYFILDLVLREGLSPGRGSGPGPGPGPGPGSRARLRAPRS